MESKIEKGWSHNRNVRHLKKCIRENIEEIKNNKLRNKGEIDSLMSFCRWVYYDSNKLIKEWESKGK